MELTDSKVQDTREVDQSGKKPYHTPKLRVYGTVKQHTRTGTPGTKTDSNWIGSAAISGFVL